jgi:hypothetical protein
MADTNPTTVLADPLAIELMTSPIPARFAYVGRDGAPRVVPVGFDWDGHTMFVGTFPGTPKVAALQANPAVALTIDTNVVPQHVLLVRGTARVEIVDGVPDRYVESARRLVPAEGFAAWEQAVHSMYDRMAAIEITPTWAKLMDFETRVPSFLEEMMGGGA